MPPRDDTIRQMPPFVGVPCVRTDTGEPCQAMLLPYPFHFRLPDIVADDGEVLGHGGWVRGPRGTWLVALEGTYVVLPQERVRVATEPAPA